MNKEIFELPPNTHTVALGVGDLNGILRGKRIPASRWEQASKDGNALSVALFVIDMTCDIWDTPYANFDTGYPDIHIFPLHPPRALPWEPGVAACLAYAEGKDHLPVPIDPRNALLRQIEKAAGMGYEIKVGTELEFYLLDPETKKPREEGIQVYSLDRAAEIEHVLGSIRNDLNEAGIPIEQSNPEYAPGQVEVNIHYADALTAADTVVMFRSLTKQLAHKLGYLATFMSKPFFDLSGNGFHTHYSVWKDGKNIFADNGKINSTGLNFLAGLQKRMPEISLSGSTTPNAYRRRQPFSFCPTNTTWGMDNRTVGLRVIDGKDEAVRVEKRDASADCNPYYLIACEIAAGLEGIENRLIPTKMTTNNGYLDEEATAIPTNINSAIELAENSDLMKSVCGEDGLQILIQQSRRECEFIDSQVTPVEIQRYLGNF